MKYINRIILIIIIFLLLFLFMRDINENPSIENNRKNIVILPRKHTTKGFNLIENLCKSGVFEKLQIENVYLVFNENIQILNNKYYKIIHPNSDLDIIKIFDKSFCFISTSSNEGFGLPPLEAMACSCPVISSNTSSMPEVISDAGEYFNPNSSEDIQQAIEAVIYSPSRIMQLKEKGIKRVKLFGWDKCAKETLDVYKKITKDSK